MKIRVWKQNTKTNQKSSGYILEEGKYNEFYLPSVNREEELWVEICDDNGICTQLHFKR